MRRGVIEGIEMKTAKQAREELRRRGENIAQWARRHGFEPEMVRNVIYGKAKGHWGEAHKIAVTLGIKEGEIIEESSDLSEERSELGRNSSKEVPTIEKQLEVICLE
jgi:gp16 family phage-associated protein